MTFRILEAYTKRSFIGRLWTVVAQDEETSYIVKVSFTRLPSVISVIEGLNYQLLQKKKSVDFANLVGKDL